MKIAQIAPLIESVPPRLYGGTERIVSYLTEELVRLGHDVRWSRFPGQNGGLAKVDSGFDYAANFSSRACVA